GRRLLLSDRLEALFAKLLTASLELSIVQTRFLRYRLATTIIIVIASRSSMINVFVASHFFE
ncbi:MAG: hypothetical protein KA346_00535, partial [Neisseriaceae bacterium]|nr:hypothetical protein [Neisseriaceae bacterium]